MTCWRGWVSSDRNTSPRNTDRPIPRILIDADVLISGSASTSGASHVVLHLCGLTLLDGLITEQVRAEAERNLLAKLPQGLPTFRLLVRQTLSVVPDQKPEEVAPFAGQAHPKDLPLLAAAVLRQCP